MFQDFLEPCSGYAGYSIVCISVNHDSCLTPSVFLTHTYKAPTFLGDLTFTAFEEVSDLPLSH